MDDTSLSGSALFERMRARRSVRRFSEEPVSREMLDELLEAASWAPTACNLQDFRFIVVTDRSLQNRMVEAGGTRLIAASPVGVLVTYRRSLRNRYYHDDIQSASACIQNLLLAAHERGLGACWLCDLPSHSDLRRFFSIPRSFLPVAYVLVGFPEEGTAFPEVPRRRPLEAIVGENGFPDTEDAGLGVFASVMTPAAASLYRALPGCIKFALRPLLARLGMRRFEAEKITPQR